MKIDWTSITELIISKDGIYISLILGLSLLMKDVLKSKFKKGMENTIDLIGKKGFRIIANKRFFRIYKKHLLFNHKYLQLIGFNTAGIRRPLLEEVFVSLKFSNYGIHYSNENNGGIEYINAISKFDKLVILGAPGAGKTTLLSYLIISIFNKNQIFEKEFLPVFIPLRRISASNESIIDDITNFENQILPSDIIKECPKDYFKQKIKDGECLFLLDGLDEVTDEISHRNVSKKINDLASIYPKNKFIVTCRLAGWNGLLSDEFMVLETNTFRKEDISKFVQGWYKAVIYKGERDKLEAEIIDKDELEVQWNKHLQEFVKPAIMEYSSSLISAINDNDRILSIATNPMLLSLISLLHYNRSSLPKGRTELYANCIDLLIDDWDRRRNILNPTNIESGVKKEILRRIAISFQEKGKGEEERAIVEHIIKPILKELNYESVSFLMEIEKRSGILIERSIGVLGFSHLSLQEYLTAEQINLNLIKYYPKLKENFNKQSWREVILLLSGLMGDSTDLVKDILLLKDGHYLNLDELYKQDINQLYLASKCIADSRNIDDQVIEIISHELLTRLEKTLVQKEERSLLVSSLSSILRDCNGSSHDIRQKISKTLIREVKSSIQ